MIVLAGERFVRMKIVIHPAIEPDRLTALLETADGRARLVNASTTDELLSEVTDADAFLGKITPEALARAERLKWIQAFTVSLEHYVFPELIEHPCSLTNMRGLFSDVIADQVMGYVLCFARNLHIYVRQQIQHRYEPAGGESSRVNNAYGPAVINDMDRATIFLPETTMLVVGMGAIGCEIARRAMAFGITVRGVDEKPQSVQSPEGVVTVSGTDRIDEELALADWVVIAAPHTPHTQGWFDSAMFSKMNPKSYLINIGRGAIVRLDDLVQALRSKQIAGAALDVFETEPLPADHPLWDIPQCIVTPHTAGYSTAIAGRHLAVLQDNLGRFLSGKELKNVVDKRVWY
jgi:phosphoglycerate dehydrogenase-like enzyme